MIPSLLSMLLACSDVPEPRSSGAPPELAEPVELPDPQPIESEPVTTPVATPRLAAFPAIAKPEATSLALVRSLTVATDVPTELEVSISDGVKVQVVAYEGKHTSHRVPLMHLRQNTAYTVEVRLIGESGELVVPGGSFETGEVGFLLPQVELLAYDPERIEPGVTLFSGNSVGSSDVLVAVDAEGHIVWAYEASFTVFSLQSTAEGFVGILGSSVLFIDRFGQVTRRYTKNAEPGGIVTGIDPHHEVLVQEDGSFYTFSDSVRLLDEPPTAWTDLFGPLPVVAAKAPVVKHIAVDGSELGSWTLLDQLSLDRIGFDVLSPDGELADWGHANAIVRTEDDMLVSLRHQDAVVSLHPDTGELQWILGHPGGWPPELEAMRLQPVGELTWPYHQHAPAWIDDDTLVLFDNGNRNRVSPYGESEPTTAFSRVVAYDIDVAAGTVQQAWEKRLVQGQSLYSVALGNADPLANGNVLATFSYIGREWGVLHTDIGRGEKSTRLVEFDPVSQDEVWDLRVFSDYDTARQGWLVDRAVRIDSLYGDSATVTWSPAP